MTPRYRPRRSAGSRPGRSAADRGALGAPRVRRRHEAAAPLAVAVHRDDLGAPDRDRVEGADRPHPVPACGQPVLPPGGASDSTATVRSSPHQRRNGPAAGASRVSRGAAMAVAGSCPAWRRRARSWTMICGCASPPMAPTRCVRAPPPAVTSIGERVWGGRRPGPTLAGWPSTREKPTPRLCRNTPVEGSIRCEPKSSALDCVKEMPRPSASMAHRCVVSPSASRVTAGPVVPCPGATSGERRDRR